MKDELSVILMVVVGSMAFVMAAVVLVLLAGLFNPSVDNKEIFAVLGPAFQLIVGSFATILGYKFGKGDR